MLKLLENLAFPYYWPLYNYLWNLTAWGTESQQLFLPPPSDIWWACTDGITQCLSISHTDQGTHPLFLNPYPHLTNLYLWWGHRPLAFSHGTWAPSTEMIRPHIGSILIGCRDHRMCSTNNINPSPARPGVRTLSKQVKQDLVYLEKLSLHTGVSGWLASRGSLQNRRGLGLLFMKQGGLHVVLGKNCSFPWSSW